MDETVVMLVTANVGSVSDHPQLLAHWLSAFARSVDACRPQFIALHCQELGGKNLASRSAANADAFARALSDRLAPHFEHSRAFLDSDCARADQFTALANFYFARSTANAHIWDFARRAFVPVVGREESAGAALDAQPAVEKRRFPRELFDACRRGRKGVMRTRWQVCGHALDLFNVHLFHDASNVDAVRHSPSPYARQRRRALQWTLDALATHASDALFVFGDFNFRVDARALVERLTRGATAVPADAAADGRQEWRDADADAEPVLNVGPKLFCARDRSLFGASPPPDWLRALDCEPDAFRPRLVELDVQFRPSYPFAEDADTGAATYSPTRCPSWCDRVLMSAGGRALMGRPSRYALVGEDVAMGDHKPVCLTFALKTKDSCNESL